MPNEIIQKIGEKEMCVCPKCGYAVPRLTGTPCESILCPKCKIPLK